MIWPALFSVATKPVPELLMSVITPPTVVSAALVVYRVVPPVVLMIICPLTPVARAAAALAVVAIWLKFVLPPLKIAAPLYVVLLPIWSISALICANSDCSATRCESDTVPVEDSVASVTARLSRVVTCDSAPSATCSMPTPLFTFCSDWVRAVTLAWRPLAIARPAASSAPVLMREPEDS